MSVQKIIDINCDMGEGVSTDAALMPFISSCNIACGGHVGDVDSMRQTVALARQHNVTIGAHPSYPDTEGFGRRDYPVPLPQLRQSLLEQVQTLQSVIATEGATLSHIKPHGALYNRAAVDDQYAQLVIDVLQDVDQHLVLFGLSNSALAHQCQQQNVAFRHEVFIDRHYQSNGQLVPRTDANAVIDDVEVIVERALMMALTQEVNAIDGTRLSLRCDTFCIHGDHPQAVLIAESMHRAIQSHPTLGLA